MTYRFSNHSTTQLQTLHADLQIIACEVLKYHDFKIQEGHRDKATQDTYFARGVTKVRWPNSKHNQTPSHAMDLLPFVNNKFIGWNDLKQWYHFGGRVLQCADMLYKNGAPMFGLIFQTVGVAMCNIFLI